ncbi:MAG TPA: hypothetical protein VL027_06120 [Spongiibacteraceae bacterium]|jgi:hypothetical protein|nr:hypothetical protein [Spongiibacteraceae bacterium]HUH37504.1 hypothetical protein [Spongiibacteraceae bacterium]
MSQVFIVRNQQGLYLSKQREWISGSDAQHLYRTAYKDDAINTVFEVSSKDVHVRATAVACALNDKGQPIVDRDAGPPADALSENPADNQAHRLPGIADDTADPPPGPDTSAADALEDSAGASISTADSNPGEPLKNAASEDSRGGPERDWARE